MRRAWLALPAGILAGIALAAWNVVHVVLGSRLYRHDPGRTAELFGLALLFYIPAAIAIVSGAGIARRVFVKGEAAPDLRFHTGAAVAVVAFLFGVGLIASRDPLAAWAPSSPGADLLLAAGLAIAAGIGASRLRPDRVPRAAVGIVAGTPAALAVWVFARDVAGGASGLVLAGALAVLAGGSLGLAAVRIRAAALRVVPGPLGAPVPGGREDAKGRATARIAAQRHPL